MIVVHPWGIDDSQGWRTPEPAGVADFCTPEKNHLSSRHTKEVIDPFLKKLRDRVGLVMYSLRGHEQPVHAKLYRSIHKTPTEAERAEGRRELNQILNGFAYRGEELPKQLALSQNSIVKDYFREFPGLDAGPKYEGAGFWDLPIPIVDALTVFPNDVVIYDEQGYPALRRVPQEKRGSPRAAYWLRNRYVLLSHDGWLPKPFARLQRVSRRRCDFSNVSRQRFAKICHQRAYLVCFPESTHHANLLGPLCKSSRPDSG